MIVLKVLYPRLLFSEPPNDSVECFVLASVIKRSTQ